MTPSVDVLVAGGGPAGLATAISCAQAGLSVAVAEPRSGPVDKACGEGLMPSAVARLAALGVHPPGRPFRGIRYLDSRHCADALFRGRPGLGVRRTALHHALATRAAALSIPVFPHKITHFTQHPHGITATTPAADLQSRYLVAADGLHSAVRRACQLELPPAPNPRFGLRRHYHLAPWTDLVEVYWAAGSEAYVTPIAEDQVGVAILGGGRGDYDSRLAAFPALQKKLAGAEPASDVRGAGPLRQNVRARAAGRVLLVGDAAGYLDALTGEGIGLAVAQAAVLAECLAAGRPADYDRAWRRVSRKAWLLTSGLLWSRNQPLLAPRIVPLAHHAPLIFTTIVNQVATA